MHTSSDERDREWLASHSRAAPIDVRAAIQEAEDACEAALPLLEKWIQLLEAALHVLLQLRKLVYRRSPPLNGGTFLLSLARASACVVGVRRLVLSGLEDVARPITRSLAETLDVGLLCFIDATFANDYLGDDIGYDPNEFWKQQVAYGRLEKRLRTKLAELGVRDSQIDDYFAESSELKEDLSPAVHGAMRSAFRSMFVPSLVRGGLFSTQALGHPSELSPFTAYWTAQRVHSFAQIFATFIFQDSELEGLAFLRHDHQAAIPFLGAYFELQDALEAATEELTSLEDVIFRRIDESADEADFDSPEA